MKHHLGVVTFCLAFLVAASFAQADENHFDELFIGDRAAGMAGAYAAIADDTAGLYYNPAGIVYAAESNISGSMNAFNISTKTYKNAMGPGRDWTRVSSELLPNFFGIIQEFGNGKIGFSYSVVDSTLENQDEVFENAQLPNGIAKQYVVNFNNQDKTILIGPSYAREINSKLSLGTSLVMHYRQQERITHIFRQDNLVNYDSTDYASTTEFGLQPKLGLIYSPYDKISLGFTLSQTYLLSSDIIYQRTGPNSAYAVDYNFRNASESSYKRPYPVTLRSSLAYFYSKKLIIANEINFFTATDDNRNAIVNISVGTEYYMKPHIALRGGMYTNHATSPSLNVNNIYQYEHIDYFGLTGSITRFSSSNALTLGIQYAIGSGQAQVFGNEPLIQSVSASLFNVFMSASYAY